MHKLVLYTFELAHLTPEYAACCNAGLDKAPDERSSELPNLSEDAIVKVLIG